MNLHGAVNEVEDFLPLTPFTRHMVEDFLRTAVGRAIFCPISGVVLDYRSAVVITAGEVVMTVSPEVWEARGEAVVDAANSKGVAVKVMCWPLVELASA